MSSQPFVTTPELMAIVIAVKPKGLIADRVLPRATVMSKNFKYNLYNTVEAFTVPDTRVGRKSAPNVVEFTGTQANGSCQDYGLDDLVPNDDVKAATRENLPNPVNRAMEGTTRLVQLGREQRVANLVFSAASYSNKTALVGAAQFSDPASDPIGIISAGLDACLVRPNTMVFGQGAWTAFRKHPAVVKAVHGNAGDAGLASTRQVAELFEVDEVIVGRARINTAARGKAASYSQAWGKHIALLFIDSAPQAEGEPTFGFTAEYGAKVAGTRPNSTAGLRGGIDVRSGETVGEVISAPDAGYFIENAAA